MISFIGKLYCGMGENSRGYTASKAIAGSLGILSVAFAVFKLIDGVRNRGKPYLAQAIDAKNQGIETYRKLEKILEKATGDVSFWGSRYIYVEGYRGKYIIEDFWDRVHILYNPECTAEECKIGRELTKRINTLDVIADKKLADKNFLTRFFVRFFEWNPSGSRDIGEFYHPGFSKK